MGFDGAKSDGRCQDSESDPISSKKEGASHCTSSSRRFVMSMQDYQVYQKIGGGKHSVVYKGRKKTTIDYYALKSVEKSQKERVMREVRILHLLRGNRNVLQFYEWYETRNHLWLVLEYCVGGDLCTILRQDGYLPEDYVREMGARIMRGLQGVHSRGILSCDLKPSNVLLDGNGDVKLSGFGLARVMKGSTENMNSKCLDLLGSKKGTPSYMAPELFEDKENHSMASDMWALGCLLYECAVGNPPFFSTSFTRMMDGILYKDPPRVQGTSESFNDLIASLLAKDPDLRPSWQGVLLHPFWGSPVGQPIVSSHSALISMEKLPIKEVNKVSPQNKENETCLPNCRTSKVDVLRLSRIVKENLRQEVLRECSQDDATEDITLEDRDLELDFTVHKSKPLPRGFMHDAEGGPPDVSESPQVPKAPLRRTGMDRDQSAMQTDSASGGSIPLSERLENAADEPGMPFVRACDPAGHATGEASPGRVLELLWHPSENLAKPLVLNKKIEDLPQTQFNANTLGFRAIPLSVLLQVSQVELESFLSRLYHALSGDRSIEEKVNVLCYFEHLCMDAGAANVFANSGIMKLLLRMLQKSSSVELKHRLASVIGLILRHATLFGNEFPHCALADCLCQCIEDGDVRVRRRCLAALGELFFFIATQQTGTPSASATPQNAQDVGHSVFNAVAAQLSKTLREEDDEICQHFAVKAIENVAMQGEQWVSSFADLGTILCLTNIYCTSKNEFLRLSAIHVVCRLLATNPKLSTNFLDDFDCNVAMQGLASKSLRRLQVWLSLVSVVFAYCPECAKSNLLRNCEILEALKVLFGHPSQIVKAKAILAFAVVLHVDPYQAAKYFDVRLEACVAKLKAERDPYVVNIVAEWNATTIELAPRLVSACLGIQTQTDEEQHEAHFNPDLFVAVNKYVPREDLCRILLEETQLKAVGSALAACAKQNKSEQCGILLGLFEGFLLYPGSMYEHRDIICVFLLPCLLSLSVEDNESDIRFSALKLASDMIVSLSAEAKMQSGDDGGLLECKSFGPLIEVMLQEVHTILKDLEPMPLYGLKLLYILLEEDTTLITRISGLGLLPILFNSLAVDNPNNNIYNIQICCMACGCAQVSLSELQSLQAGSRALSIVQNAFEDKVEPFLEPSLGMLMALASRSVPRHGDFFCEEMARNKEIFKTLSHHNVAEVASKATFLIDWIQSLN